MANLNEPDSKELLYLDDLHVGQRFISRTHRIDEAQIMAFARQFDPQPFHLDAEAAQATLFAGLAASGWHTAAISMRLIVESVPIRGGIVGAGGELTWPTPSRSHPDRGMATVRSETVTERGEIVQVLTAKLVVPRRTS